LVEQVAVNHRVAGSSPARGAIHSRPRAQRFRATIFKQGLNPYVDIPERVGRAFAAFARAGRISIEGKLNGAAIRGTLVPAGHGRHRLYVNGGMRSAAGVAVGDTVSFELRATRPDEVRLPADVAAGLRKVKGAVMAFKALPPSHRRELLRYIDDARTPETRRRRIQRTADHVLGRRTQAERHGVERPLWMCPNCGNEFVNRNQYHSCKRHELSEPFAGKPARIGELFERFRAMVEACGPVKTLAYRDKVGFMVRVRFAGAVPRTRWLEIGFWLPRRVENPRFHKIETLDPNAHVHLLRVTEPEQLDADVAAWLKEAYAVGCQEHL
jgi:predicted RNA-binding Zn-ribbon protein involved in translation (DUF1610 family)